MDARTKRGNAVYNAGKAVVLSKLGIRYAPVTLKHVKYDVRYHMTSKQDHDDAMTSLLSGRCAEELVFGENYVTTRSTADLRRAHRIACKMTTLYGFSSVLCPTTLEADRDIRKMIARACARSKGMLDMVTLKLVANELVSQETLTDVDVLKILRRLNEASLYLTMT